MHITGSRGDEGAVLQRRCTKAARRSRRRRSRRAGVLKRRKWVTHSLRGLRRVRPRAIPHVIHALPSLAFSFLGEDKLLSLFCPCPTGFYVDVGAFHPIVGSNTYKLYLRGWRGITIEPCPDNARRLRPAETVVKSWLRLLAPSLAACALLHRSASTRRLGRDLFQTAYLRSDLKPVRSSSVKSSGCSQAAK